MKRLLLLGFFLLDVPGLGGSLEATAAKPDLVIVISIDQFRYDYLERFGKHFGENGFNLFLKRGATFSNANYEHSTTQTGPGHAVILSGSYADKNGIVGNQWLDRKTLEEVYCVEDKGALILNLEGKEGRSPQYFLGTTVGDSMKLAGAGGGMVITVANKDRAAILMGGKLADAAYWTAEGKFVTSDYYLYELPEWVLKFNEKGLIDSYFGKVWDRVLPEEAYAIQGSDDFLAEFSGFGLGRTLPKTINGGDDTLTDTYYSAFHGTPFSSEVILAFGREAILGEQLGRRGKTDLLCIGLSGLDGVGHFFGPNSHEVMDMVIRLDRMLADFFNFVDGEVGLERCTILLTADHGTAPIPERILVRNDRIKGGRLEMGTILEGGEAALDKVFGPLGGGKRWLKSSFENIYLNPLALEEKGLARERAEKIVQEALREEEGMEAVYTRTQLENGWVAGDLAEMALRSFYPQRSGDLFFQLEPFYMVYSASGFKVSATHGSPYTYDTHVPLLWFGVGVSPGKYKERRSIADIAITLADILGVNPPVFSAGSPLFETRRKGLSRK